MRAAAVLLLAALAGVALAQANSAPPASSTASTKPTPTPSPSPSKSSSASPSSSSSSMTPSKSSSSAPSSSSTAPSSSAKPSPSPKPTPPPPKVTELSFGTGNSSCLLMNFKTITLNFNDTEPLLLDNNTAAFTVNKAKSSCGTEAGNTTEAMLAVVATISATETVDLDFTFTGVVKTIPPKPSSSAKPSTSSSAKPASSSAQPASSSAKPASSSAKPASSSAKPASSSAQPSPSPSPSPSSSSSSPTAKPVRRFVAVEADEKEVVSWYVSVLTATFKNGSSTLTHTFNYNASTSPLAAKNGYELSCTSGAYSVPKEAGDSITFDGLTVQPFNVKNNSFTPSPSGTIDTCASSSESKKDHTLAIAIAAAVGGLVVIAGLVYLCRRGSRSQYEELRA